MTYIWIQNDILNENNLEGVTSACNAYCFLKLGASVDKKCATFSGHTVHDCAPLARSGTNSKQATLASAAVKYCDQLIVSSSHIVSRSRQ